jgi:3-oxoacyl-[acyl-carrier protein] reductase
MFRLDGKAALVTGASGGIGAAIARALHAQGARVALSGTRMEALDALAAELGDGAAPCPADLRDPAATEGLIAAAEAACGPLHILVNNAGLTRDGLAMRMKDEDWQTVLEVDLSAPFRLARAALRGMLRRRAGRIIAISSVVGSTGNPGQANYAAAKAGLIGMTKTVAAEVARRGVTVNAVAPGFIETDMTADLPESVLQAVPARRAGTPDDVAAAVRFLASDAAGYVTGTTLFVDGGMSA